MPNQASNVNYIPQRTCVICRKKKNQSELIRFVILENGVIFDLNRTLKSRGLYVCDNDECLNGIEKWKKKYRKKKSKTK